MASSVHAGSNAKRRSVGKAEGWFTWISREGSNFSAVTKGAYLSTTKFLQSMAGCCGHNCLHSQAIGPSRRGSILAAHCSWTLFAAAKQQGVSAGALYSDVKGAYYGVIRQLVVGSDQPDDTLRAVLQGLSLPIEVAQAMVEFIRLHGSLLQVAGAPPALVRLLREMNEETWFVMKGSPIVTATAKGARPGEATADLIFIFCLPALRRKSGRPSGCLNFQTMLPLASEGYLSASKGFDSSTDDLEAIYADDAMHGFLHESPEFVVAAIKFA